MSNSLTITSQYPLDKYNLLVPMQTVAEISEIQKPVMNVVSISTNLDDKEIYEQEKASQAWTDSKGYNHPAQPAKYALTKKGLTKLMRAAGIKILSSRPVVPSTCQKCAEINKGIGKPVRCGACPNKDVKYECRISAPQLTGESVDIVAHKEIIVDDVVAGMSDKQKAEFLKFRNEMCESKALNRALRTAMQIKGTYRLEEFKKPFVVAYLVPNLDNELVREKAVDSFFMGARELYGHNNDSARRTLFVDDDPDDEESGQYEARQTPIEQPEAYSEPHPQQQPPKAAQQAAAQNDPNYNPNVCQDCGKEISDGVVKSKLRHSALHGLPEKTLRRNLMNKAIDLTGQRFGKLSVIQRAGSDKKGNALWLCKCDCGNTKALLGWVLRRGKAKSCGCLHSETISKINSQQKRTHGETHTRLYNIWRSMRARCYNTSHRFYKHYGGRGIAVCDEWRNSYEAFRDWAFSNGYTPDLTIDRKDNDGNYEPQNCHWATMSDQNRNRRPYKRRK